MKKLFKMLSLVLALSLVCGSTMAFAAEVPATEVDVASHTTTAGEVVPVNIVFEGGSSASPMAVGSYAQYVIGSGSPAIIEKAGLNPTFKYWATGAADCQITVEAHTPLGNVYSQTGLPANGSASITKNYAYLVSGTWTFTAYVVSGNTNGRTITLHIEQV